MTDSQKWAVRRMRAWIRDAVQFVRDNFQIEPDFWQKEALIAVSNADQARLRLALKACAGPGKTAVLAWIGWWFLSCWARPGYHPKGAAVSESWDNLKDNLWAELAHWRNKSAFLMDQFVWTQTRVFHKDHKETWFLSARTWKKTANAEEQGRALSGLHADYVLILVDESGGIPLAVLQRGEQALSSCKFGRIVQAGNPTTHDGMLYAACEVLCDQWHVITITGDPDDPRRSPRIDLEYARLQIKTYGRDNPWVMAYILGLFPPQAINTLLGPDEVDAAMSRHLDPEDYQYSQKRIGVDVARYGDDETVLTARQGLACIQQKSLRNKNGTEVAQQVIFSKLKWGSELEFIDGTGGWGASTYDAMVTMGYSPIDVQFAGKANDPRFHNKRAEMWWAMAEWVKRGGALPYHAKLKKALVTTTYTIKNGKILIEEKQFLKKRLGGFSPDHADSLATTFFLPEMPAGIQLPGQPEMESALDSRPTLHEHDTFAE